MRLRSVEVSVVVLIVLIVVAAGLIVAEGLETAWTAPSLGAIRASVSGHAGSLSCLCLALLVAGFVLLPKALAQTRRQGEMKSLARSLSRRSRAMEKAALTDGLTGLANRRFFDEALPQFLEEFGRIGRTVGLLVIDLDHFKSINDTHGHDVGDHVLQRVAAALAEQCRRHDVVARLGGEEFVVLVPDMAMEDLGLFADRMRLAVSDLGIDIGNVRLRITLSAGLAVAEPGESASALFKRADVALYAAKRAGRNRISA